MKEEGKGDKTNNSNEASKVFKKYQSRKGDIKRRGSNEFQKEERMEKKYNQRGNAWFEERREKRRQFSSIRK